MRVPKGALVASAGSKLAAIKEDTTPDIEAMGARLKAGEPDKVTIEPTEQEWVHINLRVTAEFKASVEMIAIKRKTKAAKLAISLLEQLVRDASSYP